MTAAIVRELFENVVGEVNRRVDIFDSTNIDYDLGSEGSRICGLYVNAIMTQNVAAESWEKPCVGKLRIAFDGGRPLYTGVDEQHHEFELPPHITTDALRQLAEDFKRMLTAIADEADKYFRSKKQRGRFDTFGDTNVTG
jgi:hypothetical protein